MYVERKLWIIRHVSGTTTYYRARDRTGTGGYVWTTNLDNADVYTDAELPPGTTWDKVDTDDISHGGT